MWMCITIHAIVIVFVFRYLTFYKFDISNKIRIEWNTTPVKKQQYNPTIQCWWTYILSFYVHIFLLRAFMYTEQHMPICAYYQRHHIYRTTICGKKRHTQKCVQICVVLSDREGEREIVRERAPTTHIHSGTTHYQQSGFKIPISKRFSESHSEQSTHDDCEHSIDFRVDANVK